MIDQHIQRSWTFVLLSSPSPIFDLQNAMLAPPSFATKRLRYRAFEQDKDSDFVLQTLGEPVAQLGMMGRAVRPLTKSSDSIQFFYKLLSTAALGSVASGTERPLSAL